MRQARKKKVLKAINDRLYKTFSHTSEFLKLIDEYISSTLYSASIPTPHPFRNLRHKHHYEQKKKTVEKVLLRLKRVKWLITKEITKGKEMKPWSRRKGMVRRVRRRSRFPPTLYPWNCMSPFRPQSFSFLICNKRIKYPPEGIVYLVLKISKY